MYDDTVRIAEDIDYSVIGKPVTILDVDLYGNRSYIYYGNILMSVINEDGDVWEIYYYEGDYFYELLGTLNVGKIKEINKSNPAYMNYMTGLTLVTEDGNVYSLDYYNEFLDFVELNTLNLIKNVFQYGDSSYIGYDNKVYRYSYKDGWTEKNLDVEADFENLTPLAGIDSDGKLLVYDANYAYQIGSDICPYYIEDEFDDIGIKNIISIYDVSDTIKAGFIMILDNNGDVWGFKKVAVGNDGS